MKKTRRLLCVLISSLCLMGFAATAYAISFNATYPENSNSAEAAKTNYNQYFSVNGSYFSSTNGFLSCRSECVSNSSIRTSSVNISSGNPYASATYQQYASRGMSYRLITSSNVYHFQVIGTYTP